MSDQGPTRFWSPAACSGGMYSGVLRASPVTDSPLSRVRASPKSVSLGTGPGVPVPDPPEDDPPPPEEDDVPAAAGRVPVAAEGPEGVHVSGAAAAPSPARRTLWGLMSRWTTPRSWA